MSAVALPGIAEAPAVPKEPLFRRYRVQLLLGLPLAAVLGLLVAPLLVLLRFSFLVNIPGKGLTDQLTLHNYAVFATDEFYQGSIGVTVFTAVLVTAICLVLA